MDREEYEKVMTEMEIKEEINEFKKAYFSSKTLYKWKLIRSDQYERINAKLDLFMLKWLETRKVEKKELERFEWLEGVHFLKKEIPEICEIYNCGNPAKYVVYNKDFKEFSFVCERDKSEYK